MIKPSGEKVVAVTYEKWSFTGGSSYCNIKGLHLHEVVAHGGCALLNSSFTDALFHYLISALKIWCPPSLSCQPHIDQEDRHL